MAVEVVSDGLLQLVVRRGFLEALAQVVLQVLVELAPCQRGHEKEHVRLRFQNGQLLTRARSLNDGTVRL